VTWQVIFEASAQADIADAQPTGISAYTGSVSPDHAEALSLRIAFRTAERATCLGAGMFASSAQPGTLAWQLTLICACPLFLEAGYRRKIVDNFAGSLQHSSKVPGKSVGQIVRPSVDLQGQQIL
jgi:hypothetical protein